uniref:Uncharacterized protein n=1 Tax=Ditylum brightwellii TaxID=49249 RepID=A0A6S8XYR0_9STRA|mmetsp:Transcript_34435/g.46113  ORF Transcript_34435/g.46113 Transcript_34435/m.46113 type:complete len:245 (+) Transcript_34435:24-758(+)
MVASRRCTLLFLSAATAVTGFVPTNNINNNYVSTVGTDKNVAFHKKKHVALQMSFFDDIRNVFAPKQEEVEPAKPALPDVVIEPDFKLAAIFLTAGIALDLIPYIQLTLGPLVTLLGVLFLVQTFNVRFVFTEKNFELRTGGDGLEDARENVVVGGANVWTYDSFVNYEFFPKGWQDTPQGPILVYFKETQTPSDKWNEGPGQFANNEEAIAKGAVPGQVHFFPALINAKQIETEFEKRGCAKL